MTITESTNMTITESTKALETATEALEAAEHAHRMASAAHDAQPTDARWRAVEEATGTVRRRTAERTAAEKRLRELEAAATEAARVTERTAGLARIAEVRAKHETFARKTIAKRVANILAAKRVIAAEATALQTESAELGLLRQEVLPLAAQLGVDHGLPHETATSFERVKVLIAVADDLPTLPTFPRAPTVDRATWLAEQLGAPRYLGDDGSGKTEARFPAADRIAALLAGDGSYQRRLRAVTDEIKAEAAAERAATEARREARDREQAERDELNHHRYRV